MIGKTISHYKILEKLGEGGMGVVYKAEDTKLNREVALKFLPPHLTANETEKKRFLQEAQAASAINHPNVCVIHDILDEGKQPFIVMEYVEGKTMRDIITTPFSPPLVRGETGGLPIKDVLNYAIQIAEALQAAHSKGIVHRDIKSENIMLTETKQIKVMDFGLAKIKGAARLTKTSSTAGTVAYMSPEQLQGGNVDARSDIFSFGVVLYEMLTGQLPFKGDYESAMMYSIANEEPDPIQKYRSDLSSEFLHVLNRSLEKERDNRYQTIKDMLIDLKRLKRDSERVIQKTTKPFPEEESEKSPTKEQTRKGSRYFLFTAVILIIVILASVIFIFKPFSKEPIQHPKFTPLTTMPGWEYNPSFSPNGVEIAYSWNGVNGENYDIYIKTIGTVGSGEQLTNHPGHDFSPAWSPDGRYIAFIRYFEGNLSLYTIQARGGQERPLRTLRYPLEYSPSSYPNRLSWSADSKFLAFPLRNSNEEPYRILSINVERLKIDTLTSPPSQFVGDTYPAFSPDGKRLAFVRYLTGFSSEIYIQTYPKGIPHPITSDNKRIWGLTWTQDGQEIVFNSYRNNSRNLW